MVMTASRSRKATYWCVGTILAAHGCGCGRRPVVCGGRGRVHMRACPKVLGCVRTGTYMYAYIHTYKHNIRTYIHTYIHTYTQAHLCLLRG
jgi:hypothetical protein